MTPTANQISEEVFPLMKLPVELRLMIYENMPVEIRRRLPLAGVDIYCDDIDFGLLQTCHAIHNEAKNPFTLAVAMSDLASPSALKPKTTTRSVPIHSFTCATCY